MPGKREHVKRLNAIHIVEFGERPEVAGERDGVAGNIHDTFRLDGAERPQKLFIRARACRVHENHVIAGVLFSSFPQEFPSVPAVECSIPRDAVELAVLYCVAHRGTYELDALNTFHVVVCDDTDGTSAGICVENDVVFGKFRGFYRVVIKAFSLSGVDLVERLRGNAELLPANLINDVPVAEKNLRVVAQGEEIRAAVD